MRTVGGSVRHLSARIRFALLLAKTKPKGFEFLTITACRCCIGLTVCGVKLPEFTCLFFKTLRVRGLVGPSDVCITASKIERLYRADYQAITSAMLSIMGRA